MSRIDLHLHSTYSDGSFSPTEVVRRAHHSQVTTLALTDHDTTDGIIEATDSAREYQIEVIPGIEISSQYRGKETHILGYFLDYHNVQFQQHLEALRNCRHERIPRIIQRLNTLGLSLSYEDVIAVAGHGSIGRPHIAQVLIDKQYVRNVNDAFSQYLAEGTAAYVPRTLPDVADAIRWIQDAGGIASLAHPNWVRNTVEELRIACKELQALGLQAIEVYYSSHSARQTTDYLNMTRSLGLMPTGGSDFHGKTKPDIEVGIGKGNLKVPKIILEELRNCAEKSRKN